MNDDLQLAQELASGNEEIFSQFYSQYSQKIFGVCYRILHSPEDAEEMVQDVFIQILKTVHSFKGNSKLTTWIHRVAVNQCLMKLRLSKNKFWKDKIDSEEEHEFALNSQCITPSFDTIIDVQGAIKCLAPGYRNVLLLHDVEGLEHLEIAKVLGISEGTSKSQLYKARLKMRKLMHKKQNPKIRSFIYGVIDTSIFI